MDNDLIPYFEGDIEHYTPEEIKQIERTGLKPGDYIYSRYYSPRRFLGIRKTQYGVRIVSAYVNPDTDDGEVLIEPNNFWQYDYYRSPMSPEEVQAQAEEAIRDPSKFSMAGTDKISDSTALLSFNPDTLEIMKKDIEEKENALKIIRQQIEQRQNQLQNYMGEMRRFIGKMENVLNIFGLYLGINEDIIQIRQDIKAPENTPIHVRQSVLYADEEYGEDERGGLDWKTVDEFDNWILKSGEWKTLCPEEKCIVGIKPRRRDKDYKTGDPMTEAFLNAGNHMLYLLIRNGECLWRIYTAIPIGAFLFPTTDEMEQVFRLMQDEKSWDKEKGQDQYLEFARNALLIQGLFDRTEIFWPSSFRINVQDPTDPNLIFIRDGEQQLPTGFLTFEQWRLKMNENIGIGSRVIINMNACSYRDYNDRFMRYYNEHQEPPSPPSGVYLIEDKITKGLHYGMNPKDYFVIRYNPGDKIYGSWYRDYHERKNKLSYLIKPEDPFVIAYDFLDIKDVEFYLTSKLDRRNYLRMMPILKEIKKQLLKEQEYEKHLVELIATRLKVSEDKVWKSIQWWKTKNKWKRFIREDDAKALRMIEKRLLKEKESGT